MKIITNKIPRSMKYENELTETQKKIVESDYNHLSEEEKFDNWIAYKGNLYHLSDFMRIESHSPFDKYWHGYINDTFFSGILIRIPEDKETGWSVENPIILATYFEG